MKVCIIGNSLTSLTLAKALVNQKIYVHNLVQVKNTIPDKTRTIGISKSNNKFFNNNIISIEKIAWKLKNIEIYSDNLKKEKLLHFENNSEELFSIIKNFNLYELLKKNLLKSNYYKEINSKKNFDYQKNYNLIINTDH